MATGTAVSSVQEWLNQFGTAQIKLNVDNDGNWDDSAFDFLAPLYDNKKSVLFTQLGVRAPDGRTTGNFGLGVRTFYMENWMFGGNVFLDDDFTGKNRRAGFGAEAWTNYLKLSANTYVGTTEWHSSRDFNDYNEKPADGYDLRAEGYLPAYPQLGAKVIYEQYYGEKVALFDKEHLQNNPSAVTVGLNYTPVPLITAAVDYKRGQDSMDDTRFSLNLRYAIGQSWESQISSDQVTVRRSLAGSRYDLVDRNNEIILQYKKKENGDRLADMTLTSIKDNSPADGTTVNTATVHAVTSDGKPASGATITWSVTGSARLNSTSGITDGSGNASVNITNTTAEQVTVTATSGSISRTTPSIFMQYAASLNLQMTKNNSQANGEDQNVAQVKVKDAAGNSMSGVALTWQTGAGATIMSSDGATDSNGNASVHFTSTTAGAVKLSASASGKTESVNASFVSEAAQNVAVTMTTNNVLADGSSTNVAQALVTNAGGQPMSGISVTWSLGTGSASATTPLTVTTNAGGIATLSLTDTAAEGVTVTASAGGKSGNTSAIFTAVPVNTVAVTMTTNNALADGSSTNVAQVLVTNAGGQPMSGISVTWSLGTGSASATTPLTVTTNAGGIATLSLTDTAAEGVTVTASAGGKSGNTSAIFTAVPVNTVAVTMTTNNALADGSSTNVAQALVTNAGGQPMSGISVTWSLGTGSASATTPLTVTTNAGGIATLSLTDTAAEGVTVTASAGGKSGNTSAIFTAVPVNTVAVTMTTNNALADGSSTNVAQALVTNAGGQPMSGISVTWSLGTGSASATTPLTVTTNAGGIATLSLTDTAAEGVTVTASAGGKSGNTSAIFTAVPVNTVAVTMTTNNALADGSSTNVAQALVTNAGGQPMSGISVTWSLGTGSASATTPLTVTTNAGGIATLSLTDTAAEGVTVTASAGGKSGNATAMFTSAKAASVSVTTSGRGNAADPGITTAVVKDSNGNPLAGIRVTWSQSHSAFITCNAGDAVTDANGKSVQTCHAVSGNASGEIMKVTVNPIDTVDPGTPVTDSLTRNFLL